MTSPKKRSKIVEIVVLLVWGGLVYRLIGVQIVRWRFYEREASRLHFSRVELLGERGKIYDRKGRLLTLNRSTCSIRVLPQWVRDKDTLAQIFAEFGLGTYSENRRLLDEHKRLFWFRRRVDFALGDSLRSVLVRRRFRNAVLVENDYQRVYPYGEVCADVVGFVGAEGGLAGIEWEFERVLRGEPGWIMMQKDALGFAYPSPGYPRKEPKPGKDIHLTIDADMQEICYRVLEKGVIQTGAKQGSVVVLDARTGAIRAMVDYPGYNPNKFSDFSKNLYKAIAVADQFEPGSSFKIVIGAAALEDSHPERFTNRVYDVSSGYIEIGKKKIKDVHPNGVLSFDSVFINSSNPACALMSFEIDPELFYSVARRLGFGEKVGIGLPDEASGQLDSPRRLRSRLRLATISFGQGVTVTLLQMAAAYLCIANDGLYLKPYLIEGLANGFAGKKDGGGMAIRQALKRSTAKRMKDILERVVTNGTGKLAAIPGVAVCGKTGTAQKVEPWGGYSNTRSLMSFVGFFPKDNPQFVIAVMIDEPKTVRFAAAAACPVFKEVGERLTVLEQLDKVAER
ncbi:MAG: penicillin-binding protein 2 [candidate division WOR-3 bacterium]|nr:penicillin-binding protein 2 [candidate division WOR-3 bacterium]